MLPTSVIWWMSDRKFTYSYKDMRIQDKPLTTYQNIYSPLKITSWWRWNVSYSTMNYFLRSLKCHCEVVLGLCSLGSLSTTWHGSTLLTSSLCGSVTPTEDSLGVMCWGNMGMVASLDSQQSHNQHAAVTHTGMDTVCGEGEENWQLSCIWDILFDHIIIKTQNDKCFIEAINSTLCMCLVIFVPATQGISSPRNQQSEHSLVTSWWAAARQWPHVITHI